MSLRGNYKLFTLPHCVTSIDAYPAVGPRCQGRVVEESSSHWEGARNAHLDACPQIAGRHLALPTFRQISRQPEIC